MYQQLIINFVFLITNPGILFYFILTVDPQGFAIFMDRLKASNIADYIKQGEISLIINTPLGKTSHFDEKAIRKAALQFNVPCVTTITGAEALIEAISYKLNHDKVDVRSLQAIHENSKSLMVNG